MKYEPTFNVGDIVRYRFGIDNDRPEDLREVLHICGDLLVLDIINNVTNYNTHIWHCPIFACLKKFSKKDFPYGVMSGPASQYILVQSAWNTESILEQLKHG